MQKTICTAKTMAFCLALLLLAGCASGQAPAAEKAASETGQVRFGALGDTMKTYFFDFSVDTVQTETAYHGISAADGFVLLDAQITVCNTFEDALPMSIYDFQIQWGSFGAEEYDYEPEAFQRMEDTMPQQYTLEAGQTQTMEVIYQVPKDSAPDGYVISYQELFSDSTTGDTYAVCFSA